MNEQPETPNQPIGPPDEQPDQQPQPELHFQPDDHQVDAEARLQPEPVVSAETTATPQPQPTPAAPAVMQAVQPPEKKKRTGLIIGIIAAAVGVAALVATLLVYLLWWQNPDRVVARAVSSYIQNGSNGLGGNAKISGTGMTAEVDIEARVDGDKESYQLAVSVEADDLPIDNLDFRLDLISAEGVLYARANDLDKIVDDIVDMAVDQAIEGSTSGGEVSAADVAQIRSQVRQMFTPILDKVNNQWVKLSLDEMGEDASNDMTCTLEALQKLNTDKGVQKEVAGIYSENNFLIVSEELPAKDGSVGYKIDLKNELVHERFESFVDALKETEYAKAIQDCGDVDLDEAKDEVADDESSLRDESLVLWVNKSSTTLTGVEFSGTSVSDDEEVTIELELDLQGAAEAAIEVPAEARDFEEVMQEVVMMFFGGSMGTGAQADPYTVAPPASPTPGVRAPSLNSSGSLAL